MKKVSQDIQWLLKEKYNGVKSDAFYVDCKLLALGEPLAYIIGFTPFIDCKIWLDSKPLIPRPETEHWTNEAINVIKNGATLSLLPSAGKGNTSPRILDLCSGSGCIGVAVAKAIPEVRVDFSEIDAHHLPTIAKNLKENKINPERANLYHTDLFTNMTGTYDFILTNPPYINETKNRTEDSVKKHEPFVALYGGKDGLEIISKIISQAPSFLSAGSQLWIEHEPEQSAMIKELAGEDFSTTTQLDQYKVERYSILVLQ